MQSPAPATHYSAPLFLSNALSWPLGQRHLNGLAFAVNGRDDVAAQWDAGIAQAHDLVASERWPACTSFLGLMSIGFLADARFELDGL